MRSKQTTIFLCLLMVATVFAVAVPNDVGAEEEFILHPGVITGNVTIPGHNIIQGSYVRAWGGGYGARANVRSNGTYTLVVEGGDWTYSLYFKINIDQHPYFISKGGFQAQVDEDETVYLDFEPDATIEGSISVQGETVQSAWLQASCGGTQLSLLVQGDTYSLPVFGGKPATVSTVYVQLTDPNDYITLRHGYVDVPIGGIATLDFSTTVGYIEGTVTVQGATINGGNLAAEVYDPNRPGNQRATTKISSDGTFRFPMIPLENYKLYGDVNTNLGIFGLEIKYADVFEGETTTVNWMIIFDSSISGEVAITGQTLDYVQIRGYGPHGSYRVTTLHTEGEYVFSDLVPGLWTIYCYVYDREIDSELGYSDTDYYYFPYNLVNLDADEDFVLNFMFNPSYIEGTILSENSPAIQNLYRHKIEFYPENTQYGMYAYTLTNGNIWGEYIPPQINEYDLFVSPDNWAMRKITLDFKYSTSPNNSSNLWFDQPYDQLEYINVGAEETVRYDLNFETAQIKARLRVATGEPFGWPELEGNFKGPGVANGHLKVESDAQDITEAILTSWVVPGTYNLWGSGIVRDSRTTFGGMRIIVDPGDVVITDPNAPVVDIESPPGLHETHSPCITVSGTVTDESGVVNFTINGVDVTVNDDGSFEYELCGLVKGENIIEVYADDIHGNSVTVQRKVILLNTPPEANIGEPYTGNEGSEITFDASSSSDADGDELQYRWDFDGDGVWDTDYSTNPTATYTWDNDYSGSVAVEVFDGNIASTATTTVNIHNVAPSANAGINKMGNEPSTFTFTGNHIDPGIYDSHIYEWDFDYDGTTFDVDAIGNEVLNTWQDDFDGVVALRVTDDDGDWDIDTCYVLVSNLVPTITDLTVTLDPTPVGTAVDLSASFTDPGVLDTHTATINWYDDTTSYGIVIEENGVGTVTDSHIYTTPGVYRVALTITDDDGGSDSEEFTYVVVYDPSGAFITGGGWIDSPEGAYTADPTLTGKASFGFVSKYHKGANVPDGNTQFRFHAGDFRFHSTSYDWMVIAGPKAMYKGSGAINGEGDYGFLLSAIDGEQNGGGGEDKFRIKIWDKVSGDIIYDNQMDEDEYGDPTTVLTHGSIKIHKA